ncbi:hypothetical protein [Proteus mirabilis]|uniref:hypothetical protein n=1 Tax=Proteus mirabilis TaxID=584 RepID=UPI002362D937|nr:hypothetical protein [Proteus mirabilis]MDC9753825.1 hypothetical protein [Proteus mirabilis]
MPNIPLIKVLPYEFLLNYLSNDEIKNKKDVYFLLKNGVRSCTNTDNQRIEQEIERSDHFSTLKIGKKKLYIERDFINDIIKRVECFINEYINESASNYNEIDNFIKDKNLSNKINFQAENYIIRDIDIEDLVDILNEMSRCGNLKKLTNKIISKKGVKELKFFINKKTKFFNKLNEIKNKNNNFTKSFTKLIEKERCIYPGGCFVLNGDLKLVSLKDSIKFDNEFKINKKSEVNKNSEVNKKFEIKKIINSKEINNLILPNQAEKTKKLDIDSVKKQIKNYLSFFNELDILTKENEGYIYYDKFFKDNDSVYEQTIFKYKQASEKLKEAIKDKNSDGKFIINEWKLCYNTTEDLSRYSNENSTTDEINAICDKIKTNIDLIKERIKQLEINKNEIKQINYEFKNYHLKNSYHLKNNLINNLNIVVKDMNNLKYIFEILLKYTDRRINKREKIFSSFIYKIFFPRSYKKSLNKLKQEKISIDRAKNSIDFSIEYLKNTYEKKDKIVPGKKLRVINEETILAMNIKLIEDISFSHDMLSYILNDDKNIKKILTSIYMPTKA